MGAFSPEFFLQLAIAIGAAFAVYGAIRADLKNLHFRLSEERRLREIHQKEDDESIHDIRDKLGEVSNRVARFEGANDTTSRLVETLVDALKK